MRISVVVTDNDGSVFEAEADLRLRNAARRASAPGPAPARLKPIASPMASHPRTPTDGLRRLHERSVFKIEREFKAVEDELAKIDCNFPKASLAKALERADFLTRHGKRGSYRWIQKYPPAA
jgi:hypothetical protein